MKPEEIFRFMNVRPVQHATEDRITRRFAAYDQVAISPFHRDIAQLEGNDAREKAVELARKRLVTNDEEKKALLSLLEAVRAGIGEDKVAEARKAVEAELGLNLVDYLQSNQALRLRDSLWDRLYAHTLAPAERSEEREFVYEGIRLFHYLELLSKQGDNKKPLTWSELSTVTPTIPKGLIPSSPAKRQSWEHQYSKKVLAELGTIYNRVLSLNAAIEDLHSCDRMFKAQELRTVVDFAADGNLMKEALRGVRMTRSILEVPKPVVGKAAAKPKAPSFLAVPIEQTTILVPKKAPWVFEEYGQNSLSKTTLELLAVRKAKLAELEVAETIAALEQEKCEVVTDFLNGLPRGAIQYVRSNNQFMFLLRQVAVPGFQTTPLMPTAPFPTPSSGFAEGVQPLGVGDLLVVKQELMRYAAGEVAHIENVLKSEFKTRTSIQTREIEDVTITETEQLEESEKDLQTTERFELQKEAQKTIQDQMSLQTGVSITAGYGPVSVTAHADFALSQSSTESTRNASTFAKQVTERSVSRIMQRAREERMRRTLERYEETNEHGFDNKVGAQHIIGIYRWVDKYYKARLINYGRRLMLEFIVPEPAAFYLYLQSEQTPKGITLDKPKEPMASGRPLEPTDLTKVNYPKYVAQYDVQDVEHYPAEVVRVSAAFAEATGTVENVDFAKTSEQLVVPKDYQCREVFGLFEYHGWHSSGAKADADCFIAGERFGSVTAKGLEGIIPITVKGWMKAFHLNVVAICEVKPEALAAWQLKTYAAIMNAYEKALADYSEQVSAAQIQASVDLQGRNPDINRKIEQDELKKGVLRLLTNNFAKTRVAGTWRFNEVFAAMQPNGQYGYPEFDINEALVEGRIIQFFEQAFEWNNMTYRFYPYTWGRKSNWEAIFPLTNTDALFTDFLRAGAARVLVPAHPAYTDTVLHYIATNEIWNGGTPPTLSDPLYISIVDELKADAGGDLDADLPTCTPDSECPCLADEWEIKLPTTLVYLQEGTELPDFTS